MPLRSMTGFARAAGETSTFVFQWELKSVNARGLDARLRLPPGLDMLEPELRKRLSARLKRGHVQVNLACEPRVERRAAARVNRVLLEELLDVAEKAARRAGIAPVSVDVASLLQVRGVVEVENGGRAAWAEEDGEELLSAFDKALEALALARAEEGARMARVLEDQLEEIAALVARARKHPGRQPEAIRERLREQVCRLMEATDEFDEQRLHQEAMLLAVKSDIAEELDRLDAHLQAARELLREDAAVGRRLDFLAQEFNREANTLCAKAVDAELSAIGMQLKAVIDRFREQVQNIE